MYKPSNRLYCFIYLLFVFDMQKKEDIVATIKN